MMKPKSFADIAILLLLSALFCGSLAAQEPEEPEDEFENPLNLTEDDVLEFLEEKFPEALEDLEEIREEEGEEAYEEDLQFGMEFVTEYRFMQEENPAAAENFLKAERMEYQIFEYVDGVHEAESDDDRAAAEKLLREQVGEMIDTRRAIDEAELLALEKELAELRTLLDEGKANRQAEIEEAMRELLEDEDDDEEREDDEDEDDDDEDEDDDDEDEDEE